MLKKITNWGSLAWLAMLVGWPFLTALLPRSTSLPIFQSFIGLHFVVMTISTPILAFLWIVRWFRRKLRRPGEGHSDMRELAAQLAAVQPYDPRRYFRPESGVFVGLSRATQKEKPVPIYIPWEVFRTNHTQILGATGQGKGVIAQLLAAQAVRAGHSVLFLDPKDDSKAPGALQLSAKQAQLDFAYINLAPGQGPQINPFWGCNPDEAYELLVAAFDLSDRGDNADVYRTYERMCAREVAELAGNGPLSLPRILMHFQPRIEEAKTKDKVRGLRFWLALEQLGTLDTIVTSAGPDLRAFVTKPIIAYIAGSTSEPRVIQTQKMLLFRFMQLIAKRDRNATHQATIMLDELKYLLSPQVLTMLSTIRDRYCNLMLAHQSLGDLNDCGPLDAKAVFGAVVVNTQIKICYKANDFDTARWFSNASGEIRAVTRNSAIAPGRNQSLGSWQETRRNLIEVNTLLALQRGTAVLYGLQEAKLIDIQPIPEGPFPSMAYQFPAERLKTPPIVVDGASTTAVSFGSEQEEL